MAGTEHCHRRWWLGRKGLPRASTTIYVGTVRRTLVTSKAIKDLRTLWLRSEASKRSNVSSRKNVRRSNKSHLPFMVRRKCLDGVLMENPREIRARWDLVEGGKKRPLRGDHHDRRNWTTQTHKHSQARNAQAYTSRATHARTHRSILTQTCEPQSRTPHTTDGTH